MSWAISDLFWDIHLDAHCDTLPISLAIDSKWQFDRAIACAGARQHQQNGAALRHLAPRPAYGSSSSSSHGGNSGPADANAGPRIFLGKLNKDTNEQDVKVRQLCSSEPPMFCRSNADHCMAYLLSLLSV